MLGKLIKHEWKSTYKPGCLMLGAVALITFFGWLAFQTPMWQKMSSGGSFEWLDLFGIFTLIMYVVMLVVVNYGILIYVGVHFYRTMYTDEGYLLHTLPVTKHEILFSKVLVGSLWMLFVVVSIWFSVFLLGLSMVSAVLPDQYSLIEFWGEFQYEMWDVLRLMGVEEDALFLLTLLISLLTPFVSVTTLFGAISIGQLSSKYRVLMAIVAYVGILVGESLISSVIRSILTFSRISGMGNYLSRTANFDFLMKLMVAVGLYFISWHVINNKLNMN